MANEKAKGNVKPKYDKQVAKVDEKVNRVRKFSGNDPSWYKITEQIGKDVFTIPFNVYPGTREELYGNLSAAANQSYRSTPGVLALRYQISTGGGSENANNAVNIAARSFYSWVRHWNSGHTNYESSDLMIYILALDEVFTALIEARRIYQTAMTYSMLNRNIPNVLLAAMQVDPDSIRHNLAQFRAGINLRIAKLSSLAMPNIFTNFKRHAYIAENVFTDSTARTSQFYVLVRNSYRVFDPTHTGGGALVKHDVGAGRTYLNVLQEIDDMLDPILSDEDCNIMSGDILKSFGTENLYFLKELAEQETITPIYDEQYLQSIENSNSLGGAPVIGDITQQGNVIVEEIRQPDGGDMESKAIYQLLNTNRYFNSHKDEPVVDDIVEGSRLMATCDKGAGTLMYSVKCGTEVVVYYQLYTYKFGAGSDGTIYSVSFTNSYGVTSPLDDVNLLAALSQFDWHPIIYPWINPGSGTTPAFLNKFGDLHRYTLVERETIDRMNDAAVMGEFGALLLEKKFGK